MTVTIGVIGDVHARRTRLDAVLRALEASPVDGILLVGDLGSMLPRKRAPSDGERRRYLRSVHGVLEAVGRLGVPMAYVPGNHDLPDLDFPGNADRRCVRVAGLRVVGLGGSSDRFGDPYEFDEDEVRALDLPEADILLCHSPPARTPLDRVPRREIHVGSEAIRERALVHPGVLVCGHIHESPGVCLVGSAMCFNVGGLGQPYGRAQVGLVELGSRGPVCEHLDLEEGVRRRWWRGDGGLAESSREL